LREEPGLRVCENRVLRRIFGLKRDEVKGGWRKLHDEELRDLYSWPSIIKTTKSRRGEMDGACSTNGKKRNSYRLLVEKPEGNRPLGRPKHGSVDNIKIDLGETGWSGMDWIVVAGFL
jgi:hypothetical protein